MLEIEILEKRWNELVGKPRTKEEVEETLELAKKIELERAKEYSMLIEELKEVGIKISSIWDLVNTRAKYPNAIPILLKYFPEIQYVRSKEGIIRSLTVPEAKGLAVPILLQEYSKVPITNQNLRWVIGNAVNITVCKDDIDQIIPIVLNNENGMSRDMFVIALGKFKTEKVEEVLIELLDDNEVSAQAIKSLSKLKSKKAIDKIKLLTQHQDKQIKKEALKALKKLLI